jgi:MFS transporter, SP family, arabinose:H+ symporter
MQSSTDLGSDIPKAKIMGPAGYVTLVSGGAAVGGLLFGYDTAVISGTVDALRDHFELEPLRLGWVVGSALVGCVIGAALAGKLTDSLGRRTMLVISGALFLVSALWCVITQSADELALARMLGGVGVGFASLVVPVYIAELAPSRNRGALVSLNQIGILVGMVLSYVVNAWIGSWGDHEWMVEIGWRIMLGVEALPAALFILMCFAIPESPRWLLQKGREAAASGILTRLHGARQADVELNEIRASLQERDAALGEVFGGRMRRMVAMAMILAFFQAVTGINVVMYYAPTIFTTAHVGRGDALNHSVIIGLVMLVFTIISMLLVDRLGRRSIMLTAAAGMGAALTLLGVSFTNQDGSGTAMLAWILVYVAFFSVGMGGIYWVVVSEIFPTRIRGVAASFSVMCLWGGNYLVSQFFPVMLTALGGDVFYVYAFMCLLCYAFIWRFLPETKGKTLEQIEAKFFPQMGKMP